MTGLTRCLSAEFDVVSMWVVAVDTGRLTNFCARAFQKPDPMGSDPKVRPIVDLVNKNVDVISQGSRGVIAVPAFAACKNARESLQVALPAELILLLAGQVLRVEDVCRLSRPWREPL